VIELPGSSRHPCGRIPNDLQLLQQLHADTVQQAAAVVETGACTSVFADSCYFNFILALEPWFYTFFLSLLALT